MKRISYQAFVMLDFKYATQSMPVHMHNAVSPQIYHLRLKSHVTNRKNIKSI